jgi:hypothetical protein
MKRSSSSKSSKSSKNSDSLRTKYLKEMASTFIFNEKLNSDVNDKILKKYYNDLHYELSNEINILAIDLKLYHSSSIVDFEDPFELLIKMPEYLGLNPHIYPYIQNIINIIIKRHGEKYGNTDKLKIFYINLAKNKSSDIISFLNEIYEDDSDSVKLDWDALCGNPYAISILTKEYKNNPNSNKLNWDILSGNSKAKKLLTKKIEIEIDKNLSNSSKSRTKKINWKKLSGNPGAIEILNIEYKKDPNNLDWNALCGNPKAIEILNIEYKKDPNNLDWNALCGNPKAIGILNIEYKKNPNNIDWNALCGNPKAIEILNIEYDKNSKNLNWHILCGNPKAFRILNIEYKKNSDNLDWDVLCGNPGAINILINEEIYSKKINWSSLSGNTDPNAIELLKNKSVSGHVDPMWKSLNINWDILSGNPNAIELIIKRLKIEKINEYNTLWRPEGPEGSERYINWKLLSANPSLFKINQKPLQLKEIEMSLRKPLKNWQLTKIEEIRKLDKIKIIEMLLKKKLVKKLVKNDKEEICIYEFVNIN